MKKTKITVVSIKEDSDYSDKFEIELSEVLKTIQEENGGTIVDVKLSTCAILSDQEKDIIQYTALIIYKE